MFFLFPKSSQFVQIFFLFCIHYEHANYWMPFVCVAYLGCNAMPIAASIQCHRIHSNAKLVVVIVLLWLLFLIFMYIGSA